MGHRGLFALALVLCAGLGVAAVVGSVSRWDRNELPTIELIRVEPLLAGSTSSVLDEHAQFLFESLGRSRRVTEADLAERFVPEVAASISAADLNAQIDAVFDIGEISSVRVIERQPEFIRVLGISSGEPRELLVGFVDGKIVSFDVIDTPGVRRLPNWESSLILLAGWALIVASAVAWRYRAATEAWTLLSASVPTLAAVLVLSNSGAAYTAGRVIPSLVVVFAAALLIGPGSGRTTRWILVPALAAAVVGALAPFARDASLIGHPMVVGAFADNEAAYRSLLAAAAGLTAIVMAALAVVHMGRVRRSSAPMRPAMLMAGLVGAIWALAALVSAVDYGASEGGLASGPIGAVSRSALVAVPAVVIFGLVSSSWARPELATLVIDLESQGDNLQPAIARALGDPSLELLVSPGGEQLVDASGMPFSAHEVPGRALTRIQSGSRLIGGLVHTSALQQDPVRLEAVAAAAGMALEVSRLNKQVVAQLDEVDASRARILEASDTARRRVERDLHDGAQQRLVALGLRLQRARRLASSRGQGDVAGLIEDATREVRDTIEEIRTVSRGGQPALLAERGLAAAVDALAERAPVPVHIDITADDLSGAAESTAYYVVAEGLTNVAKHSTATTVRVSITRRDGAACVVIADDGQGGAEMAAGSGLEGLKDRVAATGGRFDISSGPRGTTLEATIPCA